MRIAGIRIWPDRRPDARRRGMTLLETMISISILAVLSLTLMMAMESQLRLLRQQENSSGSGVAQSTVNWISARIRRADDVYIVHNEWLTLVTQGAGGITIEQIYKLGDRLILSTAGVIEEVAGPITALNFSDPDGRAVSISVTVEVPAGLVGSDAQSFTRIVPVDWIRR